MLSGSFAILLSTALMGTAAAQPAAAQQAQPSAGELSGVVTGANGPEAGVWVIAETRDLPTKYVKIVVTDDRGRYLLPDLPKANYDVWVRGYGLVDSPKVKSAPGKALDLKAVAAPNETAAAQYYPAIYWYSMLKIPDAKLFPGTGASGNGMPVTLRDQGLWLRYLKTDGCNSCHQLGDKATRELEPQLGKFQNLGGGVGAAHPIRPAGNPDGAEPRRFRFGPCTVEFRRLDGPHRQGRAALRQAVAPHRHRAQRRAHAVGLVDADLLHASI